MAANSTAEADAIRAYLASEEEMDREEGIASHLPAIFRDLLLLAAPGTTPADAARRIHQAYTDAQLASDPLVRFQGDDGIAGFLDKLYELVFDLARFATYGAARQDLLVEVLLELRKLPASDKPQRIWDVSLLLRTTRNPLCHPSVPRRFRIADLCVPGGVHGLC